MRGDEIARRAQPDRCAGCRPTSGPDELDRHRLRLLVPRGADRRLAGRRSRRCSPPRGGPPRLRLARGRHGATGGGRACRRPESARDRARVPLAARRGGASSAPRRSRGRGVTPRARRARSPRSRPSTAATSRAACRRRARHSTEEPAPRQASARRAAPAGDWPTAQEAVLKLREGAWVDADRGPHRAAATRPLAAIDETVARMPQGEGRATERAHGAVAALRLLGCRSTSSRPPPGRRHRPASSS